MQYNYPDEIQTESLSTKKAAMLLGVSDATIFNWIKTGYLHTQANGKIDVDSLHSFIKNIAGKEKLNSRAHKLQKDEYNHLLLCKEIEKRLATENFTDTLWQEYEKSLGESFRNKEGVFYTPSDIIADMLKDIDDVEHRSFLDPCCGSGNFIIHAIEKGFHVKNIYGFDTDANAVHITKKRIFEKTGFLSKNIICGDFLEIAKKTSSTYDYIFTNPPWGKKLSRQTKDTLSAFYQTGKSKDTSSLFFFACLRLLREQGKLGFLLPEAFFNISTFEDARKAALHLRIERLVDYGKPFKGLFTRAQAIILKNEKASDTSAIECITKNQRYHRRQQSFYHLPKHIFNFWANDEIQQVIEHIYSLPHTTLADNTRWGMGIVTGNNKKVCKTQCESGLVPIFRGQDITADGLKEPSLFISEDVSRCQQTAPLELYQTSEKLIYRFISNKLIFYYDTKQCYMLNSANMLILGNAFPISAQQLSGLLNSDVMNWMFTNIFHTHKILRSDLEQLPIHTDFFVKNKKFHEDHYLSYLNIEKQKNGTYRVLQK
jgi:site-specific DNA-methyltransferase (adenine-specific)